MIKIDFIWKVDLLDFSWALVSLVSMSYVSIALSLIVTLNYLIFPWNAFLAYVFTVRNLFDLLAKRRTQIFVQAMEKRNSEDFRRKSRVSFNMEKY